MPYIISAERHGFERGLARGKAEGKAEGLVEGQADGLRRAIWTVFSAKGLQVDEPITRQLEKIDDPEKLQNLLETAVTCASLDAFLQALQERPAP